MGSGQNNLPKASKIKQEKKEHNKKALNEAPRHAYAARRLFCSQLCSVLVRPVQTCPFWYRELGLRRSYAGLVSVPRDYRWESAERAFGLLPCTHVHHNDPLCIIRPGCGRCFTSASHSHHSQPFPKPKALTFQWVAKGPVPYAFFCCLLPHHTFLPFCVMRLMMVVLVLLLLVMIYAMLSARTIVSLHDDLCPSWSNNRGEQSLLPCLLQRSSAKWLCCDDLSVYSVLRGFDIVLQALVFISGRNKTTNRRHTGRFFGTSWVQVFVNKYEKRLLHWRMH